MSWIISYFALIRHRLSDKAYAENGIENKLVTDITHPIPSLHLSIHTCANMQSTQRLGEWRDVLMTCISSLRSLRACMARSWAQLQLLDIWVLSEITTGHFVLPRAIGWDMLTWDPALQRLLLLKPNNTADDSHIFPVGILLFSGNSQEFGLGCNIFHLSVEDWSKRA